MRIAGIPISELDARGIVTTLVSDGTPQASTSRIGSLPASSSALEIWI